MAVYDYCSVAEVRAQIDKIGSADDALLRALIITAGQAIDTFCNRVEFGFRADGQPSVLEFTGHGKTYIYVYELAKAPTLVEVKLSLTDTTYTAWPITNWRAFSGSIEHPNWSRPPFTGLMCDPNGDGSTFTNGMVDDDESVPTVRITGCWGYSMSTPAIIKQATIIQVAQWYKRGQGAWNQTIAGVESGQIEFYRGLDDVVKQLLVNGRMVRPTTGMRF